ncbi:FKBP-type peptidyl-prolyl cis-trans isomerase [Muriicola sp. Z0-33]|uniref:FKBP-type peptidyl-prolyl cis-trans isomerase n=1 Tax=Muriicola sp. Z0-33 TaxID=2816957 RepID=UPI002237052C|nr:hypothetical protein [Muriicola sp. Z0-33]MCW5517307.1 hypothetical protein [Muriicola sp. Z0-33]
MNRILIVVGVLIFFASCKKDDNSDIEIVPPRTLSEVAVEDDAEIRAYLETHFYNYDEFDNPPAGFDFKIVLDTIEGSNADKTPLIDMVESSVISVSSDEFALTDEETVSHTLYYLVAREGAGVFPTVADSTFVRYKGSLLDGSVFDGSFETPIWFDLAALQGPLQGARGFSEAMPNFKTGGNIIDNGDGTFTVEEYGVGLMFLPSGLGFFNTAQTGIEAYTPLIFSIDLFTYNEADHDNDGVPSIQEDVNGDGYLYNDNTDAQAEEDAGITLRFSDFLDQDDDQDGTLTRDEISDEDGNIIFPYPDDDGDGTPNYLDPNVS